MKRLASRLRCLLFSLSLLAPLAWAQGPWRDLPPEERRQMREQMRDHWMQERARRGEGPAVPWRELAPEDRRRLRDDMREQHRELRREHHRRRPDGETMPRH